MSDTFTVDTSVVERNLQSVLESVRGRNKTEALHFVANLILLDAVSVQPTVPKGHARANAKANRKGVGGTLRESGQQETNADGSVTLGFNTPYATYQHEGKRQDGSREIKHWTEPGSGKKFVSEKIEKYKDRYLEEMGKFIKRKVAG